MMKMMKMIMIMIMKMIMIKMRNMINLKKMKKMMTVTCLMGQLYAQHRATQAWLAANGVDEEAAAKWTGAAFHAMTYDSADANSPTFNEPVEEQTPGGLNEQVVREQTEAGTYGALADSLDGALARIEGRPAPPKRKRAS